MKRLALLALLACQPEMPAEPGLAVSSVVTIPASIDRTGTRDVTVELQAFLNSVPNRRTIQFPAGATYRIEGTLELTDRKNLRFEGRGATVFARTDGSSAIPADCITTRCRGNFLRERSQWRITGGVNLTFRRLTVRGANPNAGTGDDAYKVAYEAQHGFEFRGAFDVELDSVTVTDVWGDFVYLGGRPGTLEWTRQVQIHDSHFERNGRQGIALTRAEDVLIERNYIGQTRRSTFDFEPNSLSGGARRATIRNNRVGPGRLKFIAASGRGRNVEDMLVEGNRLEGRSLDLVVGASDGSRRRRLIIRNNTSDDTFGSPLALMRFRRIDGLDVRENVNRLQPGREMTGVFADSSCAVTVSGNQFENAAREAEIQPFPCP